MNFSQEKTEEKPTFFLKTSDFSLIKHLKALFECQLFQNSQNYHCKIFFMRLYENFMMISKVLKIYILVRNF